MPKISIIVPIYNISKYLDKCITSILSQSYKNFELILVNDGSTDNSLDVIKKYQVDNRVKIFSKKNGGLSDTRNYGISKSSGDYIMFVDGDDFLLNDECLKKIVDKLLEEKVDILQYKMVHYFDEKNKYVYLNDLKMPISKNYWDKIEELNSHSQLSVSACDKIFDSNYLKTNGLLFEKGLLSEDVKWFLNCLLHAQKYTILNENVYVYRQGRPGSISTVKGKKHVEDLYNIIKYWLNYEYKNEKIKNIYYSIIAYWFSILRVNFSKECYTQEILDDCAKIEKTIYEYDTNSKVKKISKLKKLVGLNLTYSILKMYLFLKKKGVVKI